MKIATLFFLLTPFIFSCKKETQFLDCANNCKSFSLRGRAYNGITNLGLPNTELKLRWEDFGNGCFYCQGDKYEIYVGKTDENGNFNFAFTVDTSRFNNLSLKLITPEKEDFYNSFTGYVNQTNLNQHPIIIVYYPTTTLTLKLFRIQNDSLKFVNISHEWRQVNGTGNLTFFSDYNSTRPITKGDTTIKIITAADIQTIVTVEKRFPDNSFLDIRDSIICRKNQNNILNMFY